MTIQEVTQPDGWNSWLAEQRFGDILQSWEWGEAKKGELWSALRIRAVDGTKVLGQAQILTRKLPLGLSLYYVPRGPVLDYAGSMAPEVVAALLEWTKAHAIQHRGLMIKIGPAVDAAAFPTVPIMLERLGLKPSFRSVQMRHTRIVDLSPTEADILTSFDKDTRNLVRRAAKEGVVVDRISAADDLKGLRLFHNLYLAAAERGDFPPRPWSQFARLWELMAPKEMAVIYIASSEDQPLAGNLVLRLGGRGYQLWAGSRRDEPKKYATYALQWATMQDLKATGATSYDMWGIAPTDDLAHPWAGPTLFKKGFSGARVDFVGDYDLPLSPTYPIFTTAEKLRQRVMGQK